jgi:class 3 adenylate cyclase/tetratricopeptide (TPR) repeat protein
MDVAAWLRGLGLDQYAPAFRDNDVDGEVLPELTADDLISIGVTSVGHRRKLLAAIAALGTEPPTAARLAASATSASTSPPTIDAERRQLTVMFCDLVGSTALSARLDPEDLREIIAAYHRAVATTVAGFDGYVAKYMGDGVLVYFGYPGAHEDDAERAVRAGLGTIDAVGRLKIKSIKLQARVGIATGLVVVGDLIGEGSAQEQSVVGETPNLAARMQALAEPDVVVIAAGTRRLVADLFEYRDLGAVEVKGIAEPVPAWQVLRPSAVESRFEALHSAALTPLVGREEEIDLLLRRWARAKVGDGQVVLASGEPGIGKSRLIAALQEGLRDEPNTRLRYFCSPHHRDSTLYPFITQLERAAGFERNDPPKARLDKLEALLAQSGEVGAETAGLFADLLGLTGEGRYPPLPQDPQRKREMTLAALLGQLEPLARQRPVLMVFEDAHWADSTSLELLDRVVERLAHLPALLVITFRPEFQPPWVGQAHVSSLSLSRLAQRDTSALISGITAGKTLPPEILDRIVERTDGIPLFVEELTKSLLESGLLREEADGYALTGPLPPLAIPSSLQDSLMARLDRLAPVKEVAQIGAALGREFSYELLAAVARRTDNQLRVALDQLTEAGLVFRRGTPPHATFIFKHALVQDAAYSTLLRSQRKELHARIGRVLEDLYPETAETQPEILAHHFTHAGLIDVAVEYWQKAGERSLQRSANAEASAHLTHAIDLVRSLPAENERNHRELRLQMALGSATRAIKGHAAEETLHVYSRARDLLDDTIAAKEQVAVLYGLWTINVVRGEYLPGLAVAQQALAVAAESQDPEAAAFAHRMMGLTLWATGAFAEAVPHLERTVALYAPGSGNVTDLRYSQDHAVWALSMLALTLWPLGYPEKAAAAAATSLSWARDIQHAMTTGFALSWDLILSGFFGADPQRRGTLSDEALNYCVESDLRAYIPWTRFYHGLTLVRRGEHRQRLELMRTGMAALEKIKLKMLWPAQLGYLASAHVSTGETEIGFDLLNEAIQAVEETDERVFEAELHRLRGDLLLQSQRASEAETEFTRALEIARKQQAKSWELRAALSLARLWRGQGKRSEARDLLAPVYGWFTEGFDTLNLKEAKALVDELT